MLSWTGGRLTDHVLFNKSDLLQLLVINDFFEFCLYDIHSATTYLLQRPPSTSTSINDIEA